MIIIIIIIIFITIIIIIIIIIITVSFQRKWSVTSVGKWNTNIWHQTSWWSRVKFPQSTDKEDDILSDEALRLSEYSNWLENKFQITRN